MVPPESSGVLGPPSGIRPGKPLTGAVTIRQHAVKNAKGFVHWGFSVHWLGASAIGMGAGVISWVVVGTGLEALDIQSDTSVSKALIPALAGAAFGLPFGLAQWLVMRTTLAPSSNWVVATSLGYGAVFLTGGLLFSGEGATLLPPVLQVLLGTLLGTAAAVPPSVLQWGLTLRSRVPNAVLWIPASMLSWAIGFGLSFLLRLKLGDLSFVAGPIVAVALSGAILTRLLRRAHPR